MDDFLVNENQVEAFKITVSNKNEMCNFLGMKQPMTNTRPATDATEPAQFTESTVTNSKFTRNDLPKTIFANWTNIIFTSHRILLLYVRYFFST